MNVFSNVVCGLDGSSEGTAAARIAARVAEPDGQLTLLTVEDRSHAVHAGLGAGTVLATLHADAEGALERGRSATATLHEADTQLRIGSPVDAFLAELDERRATLAVAGIHEHSRAVGIALGAVSTFLLHEAPCSVLVARQPRDLTGWPRTIVVGLDGSPESGAALTAARRLAVRFGSTVRAVVATGEDADILAARRAAAGVEEHEGRAVDVLAVLSERVDLVVVGSRGLKGVRALGSVSERVAHEARSSVLVVRGRGATGRRQTPPAA
jgi:nucleotide-binding universal stress UspA family protein